MVLRRPQLIVETIGVLQQLVMVTAFADDAIFEYEDFVGFHYSTEAMSYYYGRASFSRIAERFQNVLKII